MLKLKQKHKELTNVANEKKLKVMAALNISMKTFYQILEGKRPCSEAEKEAIAKIYDVPVAELFKELPKKKQRQLVK